MRLWTLHPQYLDPRGLVALWRESLLAQAVLRGKTAGYRHHPQLIRFRAQTAPVAFIAEYLRAIHAESVARGLHVRGREDRAWSSIRSNRRPAWPDRLRMAPSDEETGNPRTRLARGTDDGGFSTPAPPVSDTSRRGRGLGKTLAPLTACGVAEQREGNHVVNLATRYPLTARRHKELCDYGDKLPFHKLVDRHVKAIISLFYRCFLRLALA